MKEELARDEILSAGPDDGDWGEVIRRAHSTRRRRGVYGLTTLTALVVVGVAVAYALGHPIVDFGTAEKAPQKAVVEFKSMETSGPLATKLGLKVGVLPDRARTIPGLYLNGMPFKLYVAPTEFGGFCSSKAGCINDRSAWADHIGWQFHVDLNPIRITGAFVNSAGERLKLSYADGTSEDIPFVWVTKPIDAGFFVVGVAKEHQNSASYPNALTLYDAQGKVLAHDPIGDPWAVEKDVHRYLPGVGNLLVPADLIWSEVKLLYNLRAPDGTQLFTWIAPTRGGGKFISSSAGTYRIDPNQPSTVNIPPLSLLVLATDSYVWVSGRVGAGVMRAEARFEDGDRIELTPKEGFLLWLVPSRHYAPGHRLKELIAFGAGGHVLGTENVERILTLHYPCVAKVCP